MKNKKLIESWKDLDLELHNDLRDKKAEILRDLTEDLTDNKEDE